MEADATADVAPTSTEFTFDSDSYARKYTGPGQLLRLKVAAEKAAEPDVRHKLIRAALGCVNTSDSDPKLVMELTALASTNRITDVPDAVLTDKLFRTTEQRLVAIEKELNIHRANAQRDNIRRSYMELAQAQRNAGLFPEALRSLMSAREYAANAKQLSEISLISAETALLGQTGALAIAHLNRMELTAETLASPALAAKVHAWLGTASLIDGKYEQAARELFSVQVNNLEGTATVVHSDEVSIYAGLCALASFSRDELRSSVLQSANAKSVLEAQPWLKNAIADFVASKYAKALESLLRAQAELVLDLYLGPHLTKMIQIVRQRAAQQYLQPYTSVDLRKMATAFNVSLEDLEHDIATLITKGLVSAKIDADLKVLYSHKPDPRTAAHARVLELGSRFEEETKVALLRTSLERQGLTVRGKPPRADGAGMGSAGIPGGYFESMHGSTAGGGAY